MTIYDAILQKILDGERKIPVSCIMRGNGYIRSVHPVNGAFKIRVEFTAIKGEYEYYTADGRRNIDEPTPCLALGHYENAAETAQAIAEQNFDTEGV